MVDASAVALLGGEEEPDGGPGDDLVSLAAEEVDEDGDADREHGGPDREGRPEGRQCERGEQDRVGRPGGRGQVMV